MPLSTCCEAASPEEAAASPGAQAKTVSSISAPAYAECATIADVVQTKMRIDAT